MHTSGSRFLSHNNADRSAIAPTKIALRRSFRPIAGVGIFVLAACLNSFAALPPPSPTTLELTDGRAFEAWSVLRETDDSITVKHSKGVAKIMKRLLPPELTSRYPVVEEPALPPPPKLPPEPEGLDKPTKGERSIGARDVLNETDVRWTCRIAVKGTAGGITRTSKNRAGEFKTDYVFPFGVEDILPLEDAIFKARKWAAAVADKKPPSFEKSMGRVLGHEWIFSWNGEQVAVRTGISEVGNFGQQDLDKIQLLLAALPHMEKEKQDEAKAGEEFAATLK